MLLSPVEVMKLVGQHKMAMSSVAGLTSLHAWLGQELEMRGIDAVIYTRYILSILQQDAYVGDDLDLVADTHFFPPSKRDLVRTRAPKASRRADKRKSSEAVDCEERKKSAAVECLLSLSDEVSTQLEINCPKTTPIINPFYSAYPIYEMIISQRFREQT